MGSCGSRQGERIRSSAMWRRVGANRDDLSGTAARVREVCCEQLPAFSTSRIVEALFPDAVVTGRHLPDGVQEMVTLTDDGPVIVYNRALSPPEQRFVIAHAIAHLLFDDAASGCREGSVGCPIAEARADAFAEELMVPLDELDAYVCVQPGSTDDVYLDQVDEIASHFNVPRSLIHKRILALAAWQSCAA
jgi:Zn-dependent peptidase ImmA (M78 family)